MNFDLTDDQRAIKRTARDFLAARYHAEEVRRLASRPSAASPTTGRRSSSSAGPASLPEDRGGLGLGVVELAVLRRSSATRSRRRRSCRRAGRGALADAGTDEQRERWLPGAGGRRGRAARSPSPTTAAGPAVPDADGRRRDRGPRRRRRPRWSSRRAAVDRCERSTRRGGCARCGSTARLEPLPGDGARACRRSSRSRWPPSPSASPSARWRWPSPTPRSASSSAARSAPTRPSRTRARRCCSRPRARARPSYYAAWALDDEPETGAAGRVDGQGLRVRRRPARPAASLQVHGGIGFTWEHDLHLWLKRGKANADLWGDARSHRDRVASLIGLD